MDRVLPHIDWNTFHFLRPGFLWLLVPLGLALILGLFTLREEVRWKKFIVPNLRPFMIQKGDEWVKRWMQLGAFAIIGLGILGASGPSWEKIQLPDQVLETSLVIALDLSQSMMTKDIQPSRLERATFKIKDLLDAKPKARIALIGFAGSAHTIVPLTRDYSIIHSYLSNLTPSVLPIPGTDQGAALLLADSLVTGSQAPGTILMITDEFTQNSFDLLQEYSLDPDLMISVMPVGTSSGGLVPRGKSNRPLRDARGNEVLASIDREMVSRMATLDGVDLIEITLDNSDMERLAEKVRSELQFREEMERPEENWRDDGYWLILPFAFFLLLWFRKGWRIYSLLPGLFFASCSSDGMVNSWIYSESYQGQQRYEEGRYEQAATLFKDPLRKGLALFKSGDYQAAIASFSRDSTEVGRYNLGLAYYRAGELDKAREAFAEALDLDPDLEAASTNLSLVQEQIETNREMLEQKAAASEAESGSEGDTGKSGEGEEGEVEDLGGDGQEATEDQMDQGRKEETVETDTRMGKVVDVAAEGAQADPNADIKKVLLRKADDDPSLFLKRKLADQAKKQKMKPQTPSKKW